MCSLKYLFLFLFLLIFSFSAVTLLFFFVCVCSTQTGFFVLFTPLPCPDTTQFGLNLTFKAHVSSDHPQVVFCY